MSAPALSIITAVADHDGHRLSEIYTALTASTVPWQWLIQLDGHPRRPLPSEVPDDPRIAVEANDRQLGIAATRNRAVARAQAPLLLNVDADDLPEPEALEVLAPAFADPSVGLAFGDWVEHWPDREPWPSAVTLAPGRHAPGTLSTLWARDRWVPMHLAGAMWRTDAVLAAGGWSATVGGSDIGLLLGVDADWASVYVPVTTFTYHHHAEQVTASATWHEQFERDLRFLLRRQRALAATRARRL